MGLGLGLRLIVPSERKLVLVIAAPHHHARVARQPLHLRYMGKSKSAEMAFLLPSSLTYLLTIHHTYTTYLHLLGDLSVHKRKERRVARVECAPGSILEVVSGPCLLSYSSWLLGTLVERSREDHLLPDHQAHLVGQIVKRVGLVAAAAPHTEHVHVGSGGALEQPAHLGGAQAGGDKVRKEYQGGEKVRRSPPSTSASDPPGA